MPWSVYVCPSNVGITWLYKFSIFHSVVVLNWFHWVAEYIEWPNFLRRKLLTFVLHNFCFISKWSACTQKLWSSALVFIFSVQSLHIMWSSFFEGDKKKYWPVLRKGSSQSKFFVVSNTSWKLQASFLRVHNSTAKSFLCDWKLVGVQDLNTLFSKQRIISTGTKLLLSLFGYKEVKQS